MLLSAEDGATPLLRGLLVLAGQGSFIPGARASQVHGRSLPGTRGTRSSGQSRGKPGRCAWPTGRLIALQLPRSNSRVPDAGPPSRGSRPGGGEGSPPGPGVPGGLAGRGQCGGSRRWCAAVSTAVLAVLAARTAVLAAGRAWAASSCPVRSAAARPADRGGFTAGRLSGRVVRGRCGRLRVAGFPGWRGAGAAGRRRPGWRRRGGRGARRG